MPNNVDITAAFKKYEKDHDGTAFLNAVSRVLYIGFLLPYYKAYVLHDMGKDEEAAIHIENAISQFDNRKCDGCNLHCGDFIYYLAIKIFNKIGKTRFVTQCNALLAKYNQISTDFGDKNHISVYSFRSYNQYSTQDLINNEITVVSPSKMNDPFDSVFNLYRSTDNLQQLCASEEDISIVNSRFNYFRIRSFCIGGTRNPVKNILMWSHYANGHQGFCIKYRLSKIFISSTNPNGYLSMKKIRYTSDSIAVNKQQIDDDLAFATKNSRWKYENEVRLISYDISTELPFLTHQLDEDSCVESIYFGYRCDDETRRTIYNIVKPRYPQCTFKKMAIDSNKNIYNLNIQNYTPTI